MVSPQRNEGWLSCYSKTQHTKTAATTRNEVVAAVGLEVAASSRSCLCRDALYHGSTDYKIDKHSSLSNI